jgi:capsular exopolysaccharide synthesis family protein
VQFLGFDRPLRTIQITSPGPGEGKTTTAANLAAVLAETGRRVLLVDMDLRRPRLHEQFGIKNGLGLTSVLIGEAPLSRAAVRISDSLFVLPSGPIPPNPSELVGSARAAELIRLTGQEFDLVVIDSPPLLPVTDPLVIARSVDAVVLVAAAGVTTRKQLHRAAELLAQVNAPVEGIALNRAGDHQEYSYSYGYTHKERDDRPTSQLQRQIGRVRSRVRN